MKLRAFGVEGASPLVGYAPRIRVRDTAFDPLQQALDRGQAVSFLYFTPGTDGPRLRRVDPIALVEHEGRWHLHGRDRDRDAERTYLLSRISGEVKPIRGASSPPAPEGAGEAVKERLRALRAAQSATVEVAAGSEAALRLGRRAYARDGDLVRLHYTDLLVLADELAGYGPEVRVLEPAALVDRVVDRLRLVASAHGASAPDPEGAR
nr:WYL domain-containing protein [Agromyces seonyuensis]